MKVIIFGSTGMIGQGVLLECLEHPRIDSVLLVNRRTSAPDHPKVRELITEDFTDYSNIANGLNGYDACFFCLGVSAAGMSEEKYNHITYDYTISAAEFLKHVNPEVSFIYVSGAGTDDSEKGKTMWARIKGKTENKLRSMGFKQLYLFRPGYIQPMKGVRSRTRSYRILYAVFGPFYKVLKYLFPKYVSTTIEVGQAMINAISLGYNKQVLESIDIVKLAHKK